MLVVVAIPATLLMTWMGAEIGLADVKRQLHEMVLLPLLYPEVFEKFHFAAPRGVLFYGPPGALMC